VRRRWHMLLLLLLSIDTSYHALSLHETQKPTVGLGASLQLFDHRPHSVR